MTIEQELTIRCEKCGFRNSNPQLSYFCMKDKNKCIQDYLESKLSSNRELLKECLETMQAMTCGRITVPEVFVAIQKVEKELTNGK
jgi:hypothetical protein